MVAAVTASQNWQWVGLGPTSGTKQVEKGKGKRVAEGNVKRIGLGEEGVNILVILILIMEHCPDTWPTELKVYKPPTLPPTHILSYFIFFIETNIGGCILYRMVRLLISQSEPFPEFLNVQPVAVSD
jgi:hypothetical protein